LANKWLIALKEEIKGTTATTTLEWSAGNGSKVTENPKIRKNPTDKTDKTHPEAESGVYVTDPDRVTEVVEAVGTAGVVGLDIETTGLDAFRDRVRLLQVAGGPKSAYVLDADKVDITPVVLALNGVPTVLAHNMKFEGSFLMPYGFNLGTNTYCTQLLYQILVAGDYQSASLEAVAKRLLGEEMDKTCQTADWSGEVSAEMVAYAARDASILPDLYKEIMDRIKKARNLEATVELEMATLRATVEMTRAGLPADEGRLEEYITEARGAIVTLRNEMDAYVTESLPEEFTKRNKNLETRAEMVNWQSSEQTAWAFSTLGVDLPTTKRGNPSTSKEALETVDHPLAEKVLELNKLKTVPTKWQNALEHRFYKGRLFADWKQLGAASGRYSCARPPLQGIPKAGKARSCFVAPAEYMFVTSDLSQIEVRVWGAISGDEKLIEDFRSSELDLYRSLAERIFGREVTKDERDAMKAVVLGRIYGMGVRTMQARLQRVLERPVGEEEVRGYIDELTSAYPDAEQWRKDQETSDPDATTTTRTMNGRLRRKVTSNPQRFNTPVQGSAADVLKAIAVAVVDEIVRPIPSVELCALIHDEVVLLAPGAMSADVAKVLTETMERVGDAVVNGDKPPEIRVPIKADTAVNKSLGEE
jgi:DNA polymerase-1